MFDDDDEMEDIEEENEENGDEEMNEESGEKNIYLPGDPIADGEELVFDESAYMMYHQAQTGTVCHSNSIIKGICKWKHHLYVMPQTGIGVYVRLTKHNRCKDLHV